MCESSTWDTWQQWLIEAVDICLFSRKRGTEITVMVLKGAALYCLGRKLRCRWSLVACIEKAVQIIYKKKKNVRQEAGKSGHVE